MIWKPSTLELSKIIGVTENTQYREPTAKSRPMFFLSADQWMVYEDARSKVFEESSHDLNAIVLKTGGNIPGLEAQVRRAIAQVNADLAVIDFMSFATQVDGNFAQQEMLAKLTSLFGLLALVLASVGLYGVTAYSVERRTSEIGIRMALGADRLNVLKAGDARSISSDWNRVGDRHSSYCFGGACDDAPIVRRETLRAGHFIGHHFVVELRSSYRHGLAGTTRSRTRTNSRAAHGVISKDVGTRKKPSGRPRVRSEMLLFPDHAVDGLSRISLSVRP